MGSSAVIGRMETEKNTARKSSSNRLSYLARKTPPLKTDSLTH